MMTLPPHVRGLIERGVSIPAPVSVEVDERLNPALIAPGVVLHTGTKLLGEHTSVGPGSVLGEEGPVTLKNCQLGSGVKLQGGSFEGSVFLDKSSMGPCAHVRPGTLLEEAASGAHAVGFKQTIFLPYVTAGSLINFCDALMAGGRSRREHSEIGSSFIHFNYTPHRDKATPSLIGDVPRGVMLNSDPIFLGGQGGLVGPVRIEYGCVSAAGTVWRGDALQPNMLLTEKSRGTGQPMPCKIGAYRGIARIVSNNLNYIGNLWALTQWYRFIRRHFMDGNAFERACYNGALRLLEDNRSERIKRLGELAKNLRESIAILAAEGDGPELAAQRAFAESWPRLEECLRKEPEPDFDVDQLQDTFASAWDRVSKQDHDYLKAVKSLTPEEARSGTAWLQAVVDRFAQLR
ncbi:MAG: hypothetical protein AB7T27_00890 [Kiritimatiellia bacterium]